MAHRHSDESLILVYNADSGFFNALADWAHKQLSPSTYSCALCQFTYNALGMLPVWRTFLESLGRRVVFLHRNECREAFPHLVLTLPAILVQGPDGVRVVMTAEEIAGAGDAEGLIRALTAKVAPESATASGG